MDRKQGVTALARNEEILVQTLPDELLVYDLKRHKAHCLNRTAAFIWQHCDGQRSVSEIAGLMEKEWNTPVNEDAVWYGLNRLSKANLLQESITLPQEKAGISRRSAVRRLGVGALLTLPVVMSIVSPTMAAAASVPLVCQSCVKKIGSALQCPTECVGIRGQCFDNSGCGQGSAINCQTCGVCAQIHGGTDTASWVAPGGC